ncbi:hypothetical protein ISS21_01060 [Patescibacteria group bacterium]|nr:hypothetical protein [Patescibacteria group bacterium]
MSKKDNKEGPFLKTTFGDESRNPFPKGGDKPLDVKTVVNELKAEISDEDLETYTHDPENLPKIKIELITSLLGKDGDFFNRYQKFLSNNKE